MTQLSKDNLELQNELEKEKKLTKEINKMEEKDIGVGFTLGKEWSDKKAIIKGYEDLLKKG